ncbi:DnaJ domain-containing protein [Microbacterium sp. B2969]|uniref:DnaJ domain-containing protein n=1 Tax=Microbacterium alkaliflavum TaxID=3248839 RepID=A0ABW7Q739_9MICO
MTLDEARQCLDLEHGATVDEIRQAFRRRARIVHPDRHPDAGPEELRTLEAEFDRAREARDILIRFTQDPRATVSPQPAARPAPAASRPAPRATPAPQTTPRARRPAPGPAPQAHAVPVTLRYEEFVAWWDAAGFGPGHRSPFRVAWSRIAAWTAVGAFAIVVGGTIVWEVIGR